MDKLRIISDLHLLDKGKRDDCNQEDKLLEFCAASIAAGYRLILSGDIIELWQRGDIGGIFRVYKQFWEFAASRRLFIDFVFGNHDADWLKRSLEKELAKRYGIDVYKAVIISNGFVINIPEELRPARVIYSAKPAGGLLVTHGHQYDYLSRSTLGWLATAAAGVIERHWWPDVDLYWSWLKNKALSEKPNESFLEPLADLAFSLGVSNVVFGHTHTPALIDYERRPKSCRIMNSGRWVNGHSDFVQYDENGWKLGVF